jgi:hypothetical protein
MPTASQGEAEPGESHHGQQTVGDRRIVGAAPDPEQDLPPK